MWISEMVEQQKRQQAKGPVRRGHLQVITGGKVADGVFASRPTLLQRLGLMFASRRIADLPKAV